jgi:hypothetical protein
VFLINNIGCMKLSVTDIQQSLLPQAAKYKEKEINYLCLQKRDVETEQKFKYLRKEFKVFRT